MMHSPRLTWCERKAKKESPERKILDKKRVLDYTISEYCKGRNL